MGHKGQQRGSSAEVSHRKSYICRRLVWCFLFRLLYNSILAFIFIYIDFFLPRSTNKGLMLLIIGGYASAILFIKVVLAIFHHLKWMIAEKSCRHLAVSKERTEAIEKFWANYYKKYADRKSMRPSLLKWYWITFICRFDIIQRLHLPLICIYSIIDHINKKAALNFWNFLFFLPEKFKVNLKLVQSTGLVHYQNKSSIEY